MLCFASVLVDPLLLGHQSLVHLLPIADIAEHTVSYTLALLGLCLQSSYFPEDRIMSFFFICGVVCCGVVISSSASCRNPFLSVLPWGFPQELAVASSLGIVLRCTPTSSSARRSTETRSTPFCNRTLHFGGLTTKSLQKNNINGWGGEGRGWEK